MAEVANEEPNIYIEMKNAFDGKVSMLDYEGGERVKATCLMKEKWKNVLVEYSNALI